ncbi:PAS domain-containing protein [Limosilactobacillus kribbianus]|uniref:PAS domain-containing protein n=1 Tax=Limosilactobacillus kribbianus TaxID=2982695 RepID=UPI0022640817|nr:PAS domain-containing protein [Limosilactobacillus kribbianus]
MPETIPFADNSYIQFPTGRVSLAEVHAIFKTMPYELDYVDANDQYVWYSPNPWRDDDRLQQRLTHSVLGCHPDRVVPMVKQVLKMLHTGERDMVESPQVMDGHRTLIRYYAIRDQDNHYLGALQVTEDVEHICQLCEQDVFTHGIVEGQVVDGVTTASITGEDQSKEKPAKPDATTGASKKDE